MNSKKEVLFTFRFEPIPLDDNVASGYPITLVSRFRTRFPRILQIRDVATTSKLDFIFSRPVETCFHFGVYPSIFIRIYLYRFLLQFYDTIIKIRIFAPKLLTSKVL